MAAASARCCQTGHCSLGPVSQNLKSATTLTPRRQVSGRLGRVTKGAATCPLCSTSLFALGHWPIDSHAGGTDACTGNMNSAI